MGDSSVGGWMLLLAWIGDILKGSAPFFYEVLQTGEEKKLYSGWSTCSDLRLIKVIFKAMRTKYNFFSLKELALFNLLWYIPATNFFFNQKKKMQEMLKISHNSDVIWPEVI